MDTDTTTATVTLGRLGERHAGLRLRTPDTLGAMERSLRRHGQLSAIVCGRDEDGLQVLDGFKRLCAARTLGWQELRAEVVPATGPAAKLLLWHSNARTGLSEIEEAWVLRALYREDRMDQPRIAQLVGRHKSWVCRRLTLAEGLAEEVEADVRLGLMSATAAREVGRLPRGNQADVAKTITQRGLTTRQATRLVDRLLGAPDEDARRRLLAAAAEAPAAPRPRPQAPTWAEAIVGDAAALATRATRLHARLLERPLGTLGVAAAALVVGQLGKLRPVLQVLDRTLAQVVDA